MDKDFKHANKECSIFRYVAPLFLCVLSSCASTPSIDSRQKINVATFLADGTAINGVKCDLKNDKSEWSVVTPSAVDVEQSEVPLQVTCRKTGYGTATVLIGKETEGRVLGDLGGFGKLVLGGSKAPRSPFVSNDSEMSLHQYPNSIKVTMTPLVLMNTSPQLKLESRSKTTFDFDEANKKCEEIGLRKGTENFGMCVMKLMN